MIYIIEVLLVLNEFVFILIDFEVIVCVFVEMEILLVVSWVDGGDVIIIYDLLLGVEVVL